MNQQSFALPLVAAILCLLFADGARSEGSGEGLSVLQTSPTARDLDAATDSILAVRFDRPLNTATLSSDTLRVFGRWSGLAHGAITFANMNTSMIFTPDAPFSAGEQVMVVLSGAVGAQDGSELGRSYSFQFWTATAVSQLDWHVIDTLTTRTTPEQNSRAYGGFATDVDNDGWLDISIINEDTADVRVFLNKADGTGLYHPFLQPPTPINDRASPNEPADFDNDGNADVAVGNINTDTMSILLGNGDGTFAPHQQIAVGAAPRGVAVLDVDSDGDVDVVNTNAGGTGSLSLLLNDGNGVFGAASFFDAGGEGEWALAAADMDEDGLLDLVVSAFIGPVPSAIVLRNNGDGTFTRLSAQTAGGTPWMLNAGDVNGDGHEDVATVNSFENVGAILLGDGNGGLAPPTTYPTDEFPLATDLGDIDGDGDLDWVTSSFSGDWFLFLNDGNGSFSFNREFPAPVAASCALMLDFNNDHMLDLALIDEIADELILVKAALDGDGDGIVDDVDNCSSAANPDQRDTNGDGFGNVCDADLNDDLAINFTDLGMLKAVLFCEDSVPECEDADLDGDGAVNFGDLGIMKSSFFQPPG